MKKIILTLSLLFLSVTVFAQTPKKNKSDDKPPTQKELQAMMKEMEMMNDSISDEDKKEMEKMGIKMPDMKSLQKTISGVSDAQLKKAWEEDNRIVPEKDAARITKALSIKLSDADLAGFISKTNQAVLLKLSTDTKTKGQLLLQSIKTQKESVASSAIGFWIEGKPTLALYLMGEAVKENPTNANDLNNYAAMLSMCGAEQLAIPILNNINKKYPKNSSILNNITQAWLGLGDIDKANKYADSTLRIAAYHPQANMAKSLIEESKGNIPAAITAAKKGIKNSFSIQKQNKLESLGYQLKSEDLNWDKPMPQDPMGLEKFVWPEYPTSVEQSMVLEKKWEAFKDVCFKRLEELQSKLDKAEQDLETIKENRTKLIMQDPTNLQGLPYPLSAVKASIKLNYLIQPDNVPTMSFSYPEYQQLMQASGEKLDAIKQLKAVKDNAFGAKYWNQFGEGLPNPHAAACKDQNEILNNYLSAANEILQQANTNCINILRRKISDHLYYIQYTMWPEDFERAKLFAQIIWLDFIAKQHVEFHDRSVYCNIMPDKKKTTSTLQNFDDVACKYKSTFKFGGLSITQECSNMVSKFDFGGVKIDLKDNVETMLYNGTVIMGVSKGIEGPFGTEIEVSGAGLVEFDNTGITDVGVIAGADAKVAGQTIIGAEATITINNGPSIVGKGILQGINY